jgi:hypothetical protein
VLRPSLLPGLVDAAAHNRRREHANVRLFETGTRFSPTGERRSVAAVWSGAGAQQHWSSQERPSDFYDVKGVVEAIGRAFGLWLEFEPVVVPYMVPGRSAVVVAHPKALGFIGQLDPAIVEARGVPAGDVVWAFELDADALPSADTVDDLRTESLPRFPSVVRDLSVLVDSTLPAAAVRGTIRSSAPSHAGRDRGIRSVPRQRDPRGTRQPVAASYVPIGGTDVDGRRGRPGDGRRGRGAGERARRHTKVGLWQRRRSRFLPWTSRRSIGSSKS